MQSVLAIFKLLVNEKRQRKVRMYFRAGQGHKYLRLAYRYLNNKKHFLDITYVG